MCDIYMHKCNHEGCETKIDMHLADFSTGRDEVKVFCRRHTPKDTSSGVVWRYSDHSILNRPKRMPLQCFVVPQTENAKASSDGNHPNAYWVEPVKAAGRKRG
jgi:hypothetical protein